MIILYTHPVTGIASVFYPFHEALEKLEIDQIAKRAVPEGIAYWIVDASVLDADRADRGAWVLDETEMGDPNGYGGLDD